MGALPNTLPSTPRKSPAKATKATKLNKYGRDPGSPSERMRASSDYDKETGYSPFFHSFLADWGRISGGHVEDMMFLGVLAKSLGRGMQKGKQRDTRTVPFAPKELAALVNPANPPVRSVERALVRWHEQKIADVKKEGKGLVSVELLFRGWESLPDYRSVVIEMPAPDDTVELTEEEESKPGNQRVTGKRPVRVAAGASTKAYQVTAGIREWQGRVEGPVDCEVSTVVKAGRCETVIKFPDDWLEKVKKSLSISNDSNELTSGTRHGRRVVAAKVDHPRAGELIELFDPLLGKSGAVLLAMDAVSLRAACEAVADCDHHDLVKFVMNRAERGPIRKPQTAAVICGEALASSRAGKIITGAGLPAQSPNKKGFADRLKAEAARRLEKYGKI